jgi:hypothetical protein
LGQTFFEFGRLKRSDKSINQLGDSPASPGVILPLETAQNCRARRYRVGWAFDLGQVEVNRIGMSRRRYPIEDDSRRRHVAVASGGQNSIDDIFGVVLYEPFGQQRRLVACAARPAGVAKFKRLPPRFGRVFYAARSNNDSFSQLASVEIIFSQEIPPAFRNRMSGSERTNRLAS